MSEGTITGTLFTPGMVVSTPGAIQALERNEASSFGLLVRHLSGDWGSLDSEDADTQRQSLKSEHQDERIMSVYDLDDETKLWIITERDRSATTFLLPEEY
jgi:hypothetical protein